MSRTRTIELYLGLVIATALFAHVRVACAQTPAADAALVEARGHLAERRYAEAFSTCERANAQTPSGALLRCMALSKNGTGEIADAEVYVSRALAMTGDPWVEAHRSELEAVRAQWWRRLGRLDVIANVPGATLRVDGVERGTLPLPTGVVVEAGRREVEVVAEGYEPFRTEVPIEGTDASVATQLSVVRIHANLRPRAAVATPGPASSSVAEPGAGLQASTTAGASTPNDTVAPSRRSRPVGAITTTTIGAAAGLGFGAALITRLTAVARYNDADVCSATPSVNCASTGRRVDHATTAMIVLGSASGALLVTGAILWIVDARKPSPPAHASVACAPSVLAPGVACAGRF